MIDPEIMRAVAQKLSDEFKVPCEVLFSISVGKPYDTARGLSQYLVWIGEAGTTCGISYGSHPVLEDAAEIARQKWLAKDNDLKRMAEERGFKLVPLIP